MRNFAAVPFAVYNAGQLSGKPFRDGGRTAQSVLAQIKWNTYNVGFQPLGTANPQFNVTVDLNNAASNQVSQLWYVQSIYIDNDGCAFPVYVYFPDTGYAVSCPPNSSGWFKAFTIARRAWIVGLGISNLDIQNAAVTNVFFTDALSVPYVDPEQATAVEYGIASQTINIGAGSGGALLSITPVLAGSGYNIGNLTITGGGGSAATAHGTLDAFGRFTSVQLTAPGAGFSGPPVITPTGGQGSIAAWSNQVYAVGSFVAFGGQYFECIAPGFGGVQPPPPNSSFWQSTGIASNAPASFTAAATPISGGSTLNNSAQYGARALGDQATCVVDTIGVTGVFRDNLFGTPYGQGFIYLTNIHVVAVSGASDCLWQLEDSNNNGIYFFDANTNPGTVLISLQGMNQRLPATSTYRLRCTTDVGPTFPVIQTSYAFTFAQF